MAHQVLTGIAWDHSRAFPPLVATAQRYEELHPGVEIRWQKRALNDFGHQPIGELAARFDLIVVDHPWAGFNVEADLMLDLGPRLSAAARAEMERDTVGESFASYLYEGRLLALPIDAATPVASWRPDVLTRAHAEPPRTWSELVALARRGLAVFAAERPDLFLHYLMLCYALGDRPGTSAEHLASPAVARQALALLRDLTRGMTREIYAWNPIQLAEAMTTRDDIGYNAFAYAYHNYARPGFAAHPLRFGPLVRLDGGAQLRSVLGGTGLAVSRRCPYPELAVDYTVFTASALVQRTLYFLAGGQPSHRAAWEDPTVNALSGNFFRDVRATHDEAIVRPRYSGWVPLQLTGGEALQACLRDGVGEAETLAALDRLYRESRPAGPAPAL